MLTRLANVPSRDRLERRELRADLAENATRWNEWLWRRIRNSGTRDRGPSALVDTTWKQMAIGCGYQPTAKVLRSLQRYASLFEEAGLISIGGAVDSSGAYRCLHIEVREPPPLTSVLSRARSSAGLNIGLRLVCEARRRYESRAERVANRRRPWCRKGGRAEAKDRRSLSWRSLSAYSSFGENGPYALRARGAVRFSHECARARGTGDAHDAEPGSAALTTAGEKGERETRRRARQRRRYEARVARLRAETRRQIRDGDLIPRWERKRYEAAAGDSDAERELYGNFASFLSTIPGGAS